MIERTHPLGRLVFDRDAIVRAALRAYFEAIFGNGPLQRLSFPVCGAPGWKGDLQRGAFFNGGGCGSDQVVAWTEAGVVGLAYQLGFGPVEHFRLSVDAVTGGPDDVRGAVPGLPGELEPAFVMAVSMLAVGCEHGERLAGVGFWLYGDQVAGTLFDDPTLLGARELAAWGLIRNGRLALTLEPRTAAKALELGRTRDAAMHALIDAVVDRRMAGPAELTTGELAMLFPTPPKPEHLLYAQRMLQKVGITWPGSPELPEEPRAPGR